MSFALAPGVSFCRTAGRLVFLDIDRDRYLCLAPAAEQAFDRYATGCALNDGERARLDGLADGGPLCRSTTNATPAPPPYRPARGSVLDRPRARVGVTAVATAGLELAGAALRLKVQGLGRVLRATAERKARAARAGGSERVPPVAAAFERLSTVTSAHDRCLVRSIAVARRLIACGVAPNLVIGVRLGPFKAHCWVEHDGYVVNDRLEIVRPFTPVLIL